MNEQYDFTSDLIKENTKGNEQSLNLPLDEIPTDFDYKSPILLVSSNPLPSHLFARRLRSLYRKSTGKTISGIYVTTISPYVRLLDYVSVFDPETLNKYSNQILLINFNVDQKHPLVVDLFDTYVVPRILELAKDRLVILVSDNPFVYEHYKYVRMLRINLNERFKK